jgi:methyl-accepting chemotaxis protein
MFKNLKLGVKFTLLLLLVFIIGIGISWVALSNALLQNAQTQVAAQAQLLLEMMEAVRNYTNAQINPILTGQAQAEFFPQAIPQYSAREVFEEFRQNESHKNYFYKDAALNPISLRDKADDFEAELVGQFRQPEQAPPELFGFRDLFEEQVFYSARPVVITNESCLRCHGDPAQAPKGLLAAYGASNGFGWQLNEVVGAHIIYVPAQEVINSARQSFILMMGIFMAIFLVVILLINFLLRQYVIRPVGYMGELAQKITGGGMIPADFEHAGLNKIAARSDELGQSVQLFLKMAREVYERELRLKEQVQQLRIEIDEAKKSRQVAEIVETDYFQDLQKKAGELRKRGGKSAE